MDWMKEKIKEGWSEKDEEISEMVWQVDGTFRVCSNCGAVFHVQSGDGRFNFCPTCGIKIKGIGGK